MKTRMKIPSSTVLEAIGAVGIIVGLGLVHLGLGLAVAGLCLILVANFGGENAGPQ